MGATTPVGVWCTGCGNALGWFETTDEAEGAAQDLRNAEAGCYGCDIVVIDFDDDGLCASPDGVPG